MLHIRTSGTERRTNCLRSTAVTTIHIKVVFTTPSTRVFRQSHFPPSLSWKPNVIEAIKILFTNDAHRKGDGKWTRAHVRACAWRRGNKHVYVKRYSDTVMDQRWMFYHIISQGRMQIKIIGEGDLVENIYNLKCS